MKIASPQLLPAAVLCLAVYSIARADTYATFTTRRFYSANAHYFVEVKPDKQATLYRMQPRTERIWSQALPELPARLFVSNDGTRVVMIDHYYGNGSKPSANVLFFFDEVGKQIAGHALKDVADLERVLHTTSSAHWYYGALFTPDQGTFVVETVVTKCPPPKTNPQTPEEVAAAFDCWKSMPHEELHFSMANGVLLSRADIREKYTDRGKRLLHELDLAFEEHPPDDLVLGYLFMELGRFYEQQKQSLIAIDFYEKAIATYSGVFGPAEFNTVRVVGEAATSYRNAGDYRHAEAYFRRALNALERRRRPQNVSPIAITFCEEYAVFLRERNRVKEAEKIERRVKELRSIYPDYKPDK